MNAHRTGTRAVLTLAACVLLAACATQPQKPRIAVTPAPLSKPAPSPIALAPVIPALTALPAEGQPWAGIVASGAIEDCTDSRLVRANAAMYTRSPARFEALLANSLPLIVYVSKQLQAAGIPGEFAMLPMLESSYNPAVKTRRGGPAGMWQFMPATARRHGMLVNKHYDGRLDPVASTRAAIRMLKALDSQFGDWRLVTMAYNAGPQTITSLLAVHPDSAAKPIAAIKVSQTTRTHLARMLALNCILAEPQRFHVKLPRPNGSDALEAVSVPAGTRLQAAAGMAGIPESRLRALNPGYLGASVPADSPRTLLLPGGAAQILTAALAIDSSESVAQVDASDRNAYSSDDLLPRIPPRDDLPAASPETPERHRVRAGETLSGIARRYDVSVRDLKRWNELSDSDIRIGEWLRVQG